VLYKIQDGHKPNVADAIAQRKVDLIINVPTIKRDTAIVTIRRLAIDHHIPLVTNAETGALLLRCLAEVDLAELEPRSWQEFVGIGGVQV
jgi:methylglyoxal synthase